MNRKHVILILIFMLLTAGIYACGGSSMRASADAASADASAAEEDGPQITGSMELLYAEQFSVDYCADGCAVITIAGTDTFLLVPEDMEVPDYADGMTVICQPLSDIYLAASSAMDLFVELDALERISFTSTVQESWSIEEAAAAMESGNLIYVGKYSAPDFETLLSDGCSLAIESTMIYHSPEIQEQLINLGIPVLVERSSYETHPLGRAEWIRLYGLLTGCEEEAEALFARKAQAFEEILAMVSEEPAQEQTAAYFYITSAGAVNIRKPADYIAKLIEYAGGTYAFTEEDLDLTEDNALSTMTIQFEAFYEKAKDADVLIYNSSIAGELETVDQLTELNVLFAEFTAVQTGDVWCTEKDMFQQSGAAADILAEFYAIFTGTAEEQMQFFHKLE